MYGLWEQFSDIMSVILKGIEYLISLPNMKPQKKIIIQIQGSEIQAPQIRAVKFRSQKFNGFFFSEIPIEQNSGCSNSNAEFLINVLAETIRIQLLASDRTSLLH